MLARRRASFPGRWPFGALAQLVERLLCKQEVGGSIPPGSTKPLLNGTQAPCVGRPRGKVGAIWTDIQDGRSVSHMTRRLTADDLEDYYLEPDIEQTLAGPVKLTDFVPLTEPLAALEEIARAAAEATKDTQEQTALGHYADALQSLGSLSDGSCGLALDPDSSQAFIHAVAIPDWKGLLAVLSAYTQQIVARRQSVPGWMSPPTIVFEDVAARYRYEVELQESEKGVRSWVACCREMPEVCAWGETPGAAIDAVFTKVATRIIPALMHEYDLVPRPAK